MQSAQNNSPHAAWPEDALDSPDQPVSVAPYFDHSLHAWVLTRYEDILTAFRTPALFPVGPTHKLDAAPPDERARMAMRTESMAALSPTQVGNWSNALLPQARLLAAQLPEGQPFDLLAGFATPLCFSLAVMVTGICFDQAKDLQDRAAQVSAAAAEPLDPVLRTQAKAAGSEMRACFSSGPEALRSSGFVAISQTLPSLLGNLWFALIQAPGQWGLLHQEPARTEQAMDELMRYAGLARTLTRQARTDFALNGALVREGERVILRIVAGNHDPDRFPDPHRVDVTRRGGGHFTLGASTHACVAAGLIRTATATITRSLLERFAEATFAEPVQWKGGSGFRTPTALRVHLKCAEVQLPPAFFK